MKVEKKGKREVLTGKAEYKAPRRFWTIKPTTKPHSSPKGKKGYSRHERNNRKWQDE